LTRSGNGNAGEPFGHLHPNISKLEGKTISFYFRTKDGTWSTRPLVTGPMNKHVGVHDGDMQIAGFEHKVGTSTVRNIIITADRFDFYTNGHNIPINRR
jgi:hypothetical protein